MKKSFHDRLNRCLFFIITFIHLSVQAYEYDLTIAGFALYTEALGRLSITSVATLKDDLKINYIPIDNAFNPAFISKDVLNIMENPDRSYGAISLIYQYNEKFLKECDSKIKIFYTMFDSSDIPYNACNWINNHFDAIVVPDEWLVPIYRKGGVSVPIFVLPCLINLDDFLEQYAINKTRHPHEPFVFGSSGAFVPRKNHLKALEAFIKEFGNSPLAKLKLHGRWGSSDQDLHVLLAQTGVTNVEIINKTFTQEEYLGFLNSLDCYVFLSKGEGYSITPREALANGIPCILSNNTARTTLCNSGYVNSIPLSILEPSYNCNDCGGNAIDCKLEDVCLAMRHVFGNYKEYLELTAGGRQWIRQYNYKSLKPYYLSLVKPKRVILGKENKICDDFIMTDSVSLFNKYKELGITAAFEIVNGIVQ